MSILTTCIGAWPKPAYLTTGNWAESLAQDDSSATRSFTYTNDAAARVPESLLSQATGEAIADQLACGVDIPTDGEQRRENYIHYHCRHIEGIDFARLTEKVHRNGAAIAALPSVVGPVRGSDSPFLVQDFINAQSFSPRPVKITVPGPLTIVDTTANLFYETDRELAFDLADALNREIHHLAQAGCRYIQVDEPLFARKVEDALGWGVECLERCFHGLPDSVTRVMHMCCGYPGHVDDEEYLKADPDCYARLAGAIDRSVVQQVSIEDAHRHNKLDLLEQFQRTEVILGVVAVARSRLESMEEIRARLQQALNHIERERLLAAPDCGLAMLDRDFALEKLANLCRAARSL